MSFGGRVCCWEAVHGLLSYRWPTGQAPPTKPYSGPPSSPRCQSASDGYFAALYRVRRAWMGLMKEAVVGRLAWMTAVMVARLAPQRFGLCNRGRGR